MRKVRQQYLSFVFGMCIAVVLCLLGVRSVLADTQNSSVTVSATVGGGGAVCGNSTVESGEQCDDGNTHNGDGCSSTCQTESGPVCGNGSKESGEQCDDGNTTSGDGCSSICTVEGGSSGASNGGVCGDAYRDRTEQCDDGNTINGDGCSSVCVYEYICGNRVQEVGETCDDGNIVNGDGCSSACQREGVCGNTVIESGETCDDGNTQNYDGCSSSCLIELCGNGVLNPGEQCDDGNHLGTDSCTALCQTNLCGNGVIDVNEFCDDGNTSNGDGCSNTCQSETQSCDVQWREYELRLQYLQGLNLRYLRGEEIDSQLSGCVNLPSADCDSYRYNSYISHNPNTYSSHPVYQSFDTYSAYMQERRQTAFPLCYTFDSVAPRCGDGKLDVGEECDWKDPRFANGGCTNVCRLASASIIQLPTVCGNSIKESSEECDDGNRVPGDGCSMFCKVESPANICGNGIQESGEACDDGNTNNIDGCDTVCHVNMCGNGTLEQGEFCDDSNTASGDGCSSACQFEMTDATCNVVWNDFVVRREYMLAQMSLWQHGADVEHVICVTMPGSACDQYAYDNRDAIQFSTQKGAFQIGSFSTFSDFQNKMSARRPLFTPAYCLVFNPHKSYCGNGVLDVPEQCDDANSVDGDGCSAACQNEVTASCGDGILQIGETCDDGNRVSGDGCSITCTAESVCGNTLQEAGESCDDGNTTGGDGCSSLCVVEAAVCGNAKKEAGEQCDDGNANNTDGCDTLCHTSPCGNGVLEVPEFCDDGNVANDDGCSATCQIENVTCALAWKQFSDSLGYITVLTGLGSNSGVVGKMCTTMPDASCDDYAYNNQSIYAVNRLIAKSSIQSFSDFQKVMESRRPVFAPYCVTFSAPKACGNGKLEPPEQCDDGNLINSDGCSSACVREPPVAPAVCGNGIREVGEACDDRNTANNDGCSSMCLVEAARPPLVCIPGIDPLCPNPVDTTLDTLQDRLADTTITDVLGLFPGADFIRELLRQGATREEIQSLLQQLDPTGLLQDQAGLLFGQANNFIHSGAEALANGIDIFQTATHNPAVEQMTRSIVVPAAVSASVITIAPSLASVAIPLFRYVFLQPLLFVGKRKRRDWGQIYDSFTRLPVDLALVRLVDTKQNRVVQSRVTDGKGRYVFIVEPGEYVIDVVKQGYVFPTQLLHDAKSDGRMLDIYHGEKVIATSDGIVITPNIPLDPVGITKTIKRIVWEKWLRGVQHAIALLGIGTTLVSLYVSPSWLIASFLVLHITLYTLFNRYIKPKKPKGWGIVYEADTRQPLGKVVARLFTKQYNKLVSAQVTDPKGRYAFLVGPNNYYVTFEKTGYAASTFEKKVDDDQSQGFINDDVGLKKQEPASPVPSPLPSTTPMMTPNPPAVSPPPVFLGPTPATPVSPPVPAPTVPATIPPAPSDTPPKID